jgi:hypothetical protein
VIDDCEDGSGDGADGLFGTAPGTNAVELGLDVAALVARRSPAALDQGGLRPRSTFRTLVERRFAGTHRAAQEMRCAAVANRLMSLPISGAMTRAPSSLIPGMVVSSSTAVRKGSMRLFTS